MSTTATLSVFATACLGLATFQGSLAADAEARLAALEKETAALRKVVETQSKDATEAKALAEGSARYAAEQAKAAATMLETLDASEKAGFTFGINPESRIVLLRGWREALSAAQRDVPALPTPAPTPAPARTATQGR